MGWRRDIRRFRTDRVDEALLQECLDAFLLAPSVVLSKPSQAVHVNSKAARIAALRVR
ncbi:nitroreductase family protein [Aliiroseovarius sp. S1339]|uniref:nitroreductase family protein n=1 Tax=Aliiroseovarius sp. S1339 TaxID=2936990 RepID=UPI0020C0DD5C|nr:nitroreductase family protein [Aliiroseovarius sp. S1339]MCK8465032.1 nitroreductase family protein [Aliiroseovarius sp. S1339]